MEVRAVVLAVHVEPGDAEELRSQGLEVHTFAKPPSLRELAEAALELRKHHPRARLLVAGPERLVRQLAERYPPLVDVPLSSAGAKAVLAALDS
ncbi:MAG TPA: hypothetical protein VK457_14735 [Chloroflexota bacterium]|jgi:hypothetical protein|nr:hypothetical protein [Chloroflexota bacterium]